MHAWRGTFTALAVAVLTACGLAGESAGAATLVELFTAQGCAACPPANARVAALAERDDVVVLFFHVDYWDYTGWKDPFALAAATERQRRYGRRLSGGKMYTPEVVVDGLAHAVGSDVAAIERAIERARAARELDLDIDLGLRDDGVIVSIPGVHYVGTAAVWLVLYDDEQVTRVTAGENAGQTVRSVNVVRYVRRIGTWRGLPLELRLNTVGMEASERDGCAVIVQAGTAGPVLGVRRLALP